MTILTKVVFASFANTIFHEAYAPLTKGSR